VLLCFHTVTGIGSFGSIKPLPICLQEARARLLAEAEDVASIGFGVGYDSPSQFRREYRHLFGAPPGRDIARLRTVSVLERSVI